MAEIRRFQRGTAIGHYRRLRLGGAEGCVDLSLAVEPRQIAALGVLFDFLQKLNRFRFVTWLAWVVDRNDQLDFDGNDVFLRLNQPRSFDPLAGNTHG
jgi:hypothetical protein